MVYGTAGYAYGGCDGCSTLDGWAAGGGVEYKFNPSWSVKAEYQRVDFSEDHEDASADTFRVGVNYFVGGSYESAEVVSATSSFRSGASGRRFILPRLASHRVTKVSSRTDATCLTRAWLTRAAHIFARAFLRNFSRFRPDSTFQNPFKYTRNFRINQSRASKAQSGKRQRLAKFIAFFQCVIPE